MNRLNWILALTGPTLMKNQVVLVMSSFGTSNYDITFDRINVELIPYVQALIGTDFEHSVYHLRLVSKGKL